MTPRARSDRDGGIGTISPRNGTKAALLVHQRGVECTEDPSRIHYTLECASVEPSRTLERLRHKLSPASINSYYRCPRKFQFRYIRNVRMPFEFGPALAIGSVTHKALAEIFRQRRDGRDGASAESY